MSFLIIDIIINSFILSFSFDLLLNIEMKINNYSNPKFLFAFKCKN